MRDLYYDLNMSFSELVLESIIETPIVRGLFKTMIDGACSKSGCYSVVIFVEYLTARFTINFYKINGCEYLVVHMYENCESIKFRLKGGIPYLLGDFSPSLVYAVEMYVESVVMLNAQQS